MMDSPLLRHGSAQAALPIRKTFAAAAPCLVALLGQLIAVQSLAATAPGAPRLRVIPSEEVLAEHTMRGADGELLFLPPSGSPIRLITTTEDPQIQNPGDGAFHPADTETVLEALGAIDPRTVASLGATIYLLPCPRSGLLSSSAEAGAIYLSPGVREYEAEQVHYLVAHEMGHVFQYAYLPDSDRDGWDAYSRLRGIADPDRYRADAPHADRPHEIFAEDFRVLFGGAIARGDGSVENREIIRPGELPGLDLWILDRVPAAGIAPQPVAGMTAWRLSPNPLRPGGTLLLSATENARGADRTIHAALFGPSGRRVRVLDPKPLSGDRWDLGFDGKDSRGRLLGSGAYWVRLDSGTDPPATLPLRWIR